MIWHKRFGHFNFSVVRKHLAYHNIYYIKDESVCDSCKRAKATKHYNCTLQKRAKRAYQFIYINLVRPIILIGFGAKRYFFTFTDDHTCIIKTYTRKRKSKWLKSLKVFYNLVHTCTGFEQSIKRLSLDYGSEL